MNFAIIFSPEFKQKTARDFRAVSTIYYYILCMSSGCYFQQIPFISQVRAEQICKNDAQGQDCTPDGSGAEIPA